MARGVAGNQPCTRPPTHHVPHCPPPRLTSETDVAEQDPLVTLVAACRVASAPLVFTLARHAEVNTPSGFANRFVGLKLLMR